MKHLNRLCLTLMGTSFLALSGCGGGSSGTSNASGTATTSTCKYGGSTKSYATNTDMKDILSECEFNRLFRGQNDLNLYPTMYGENPGRTKQANDKLAYKYYSYNNLVTAYNHLFKQHSNLAPFNSGDYMTDMRELSAFLANISQETNANSPATFDSALNLTTAGALGNGYGLYAITEGSCTKTNNCAGYGTKQNYCTVNVPSICSGDASDPWSAAGKPFCKLAIAFCDTSKDANGVYHFPDSSLAANQYFGRGGKQLSYPYNYMYYGSYINPNDPYKIADNPRKIS